MPHYGKLYNKVSFLQALNNLEKLVKVIQGYKVCSITRLVQFY